MTVYVEIPLEEVATPTGLQNYIKSKSSQEVLFLHKLPKPLIQRILREFLESCQDVEMVQLTELDEFLHPFQKKYSERRAQIKDSNPDQWLNLFYDLSNGQEQFNTSILESNLEHLRNYLCLNEEELKLENFVDALRQVCMEADVDGNNEITMEKYVCYIQKQFNSLSGSDQIAGEIARSCNLCSPPKVFIFVLTFMMFILGVAENYDGEWTQGEWTQWERDSDWENSKVSNALMLYPCRRSQIYRFITLAFAHRGLKHLGSNCILTLWFGLLLEANQKGWISSLRVTTIFFSGVIYGSLLVSLIEPQKSNQGASCGVYALIGGHVAYILLNWKEEIGSMKTMCKKLWNPFLAPMGIVSIFLFLGVDVCFSITSDIAKISHEGHIIGCISGLLVGLVVVENSVKGKWATYVQKFLFVLLLVAFIGLIIAHFVFTYIPINGTQYYFTNESAIAHGGKCTF